MLFFSTNLKINDKPLYLQISFWARPNKKNIRNLFYPRFQKSVLEYNFSNTVANFVRLAIYIYIRSVVSNILCWKTNDHTLFTSILKDFHSNIINVVKLKILLKHLKRKKTIKFLKKHFFFMLNRNILVQKLFTRLKFL